MAFDHSCMSLFDITPSIELEIIPCEIRDSTCDFDLCCSCNLCSFSDSSRVCHQAVDFDMFVMSGLPDLLHFLVDVVFEAESF